MVIAVNLDARFNKIYYYYICIQQHSIYRQSTYLERVQCHCLHPHPTGLPRHYLHPTPKLKYNCFRNQTYNVPHRLVLWLKGTYLFCYTILFFFLKLFNRCLIFYFLNIFPLPIGFFLYGQTLLTSKEQRREHFQHRPFSAKSSSVGTG